MRRVQSIANCFTVLGCVLPALSGCAKHSDRDATARRGTSVFSDVTTAAGITHRHQKPILDAKLDNIMNWVCSVGASAATADFDNDGWLDLYVTNSRKGTPNYLYRNNGDGTFTDTAASAGVAMVNNDGGTSMDCVWGDYDNDGWIDLYLVRWGNDILFHNNGDGTFEDVTTKLIRRRDGRNGTDWTNGNAVIFFDFNLDGRLDIYVGNYFDDVDLWHLETTRIMHDDFERARNGGKNALYRQNADGTFSEVAASLGVDDPGWTLAVGAADINNDGWPDLYCADDFGPDQLFVNNGDGTFTNVSEDAIGFDTKKGMNVDFGDFNNDGWLDIYVANITTAEYLQEGNMLWRNNGLDPTGSVSFSDVAAETGTYDGGWGWGAKFFDYDNDGDLDLLAVNGFISAGEGNYWYDLASWTVLGEDSADAANWPAIGDRSFSGYEAFRLWRNDGFDSFSQRAAEVGLGSDRDGRGVVCFDYDNDGDVDVFVANHDQPPQLFRNDSPRTAHWLTVALEADAAPRVTADAVGARVTVVTDVGLQLRERDGGNGYCGQSDPRLHFGLGSSKIAKLVEVRWPDGGLQYLENVAADQRITIRRDPSHYATDAMVVVKAPARHARQASDTSNRVSVSAAKADEILAPMEEKIRSQPADFALTDSYRSRCVALNRHDRSIGFLKEQVEAHPEQVKLRIALSGAYVDKIPTCGGLAAIVSKGTLARQALDVLDGAIQKFGPSWTLLYARGMNHLHWPRALRHSDDAVADFERCLEMQLAAGPPNAKTYYERTYIVLGDANAKNKSYQEARRIWRDGLEAFPESKTLQSRLSIKTDADMLHQIERERGLENPIDTNFAFIEREP